MTFIKTAVTALVLVSAFQLLQLTDKLISKLLSARLSEILYFYTCILLLFTCIIALLAIWLDSQDAKQAIPIALSSGYCILALGLVILVGSAFVYAGTMVGITSFVFALVGMIKLAQFIYDN